MLFLWVHIKSLYFRIRRFIFKNDQSRSNLRTRLTDKAVQQLRDIKLKSPKTYQKVIKTLGYLESNRRDSSFRSCICRIPGPRGEQVFESCPSDNPTSFQIYWFVAANAIEPTLVIVFLNFTTIG